MSQIVRTVIFEGVGCILNDVYILIALSLRDKPLWDVWQSQIVKKKIFFDLYKFRFQLLAVIISSTIPSADSLC